eukprot:symbB.v1.2.000015.t1/scaffold5.1/size591573/15
MVPDIARFVFDTKWGFALAEGYSYTAPVWMGEFGQMLRGSYWLNMLRYLAERDIDFAYWPLNGLKYSEGYFTKSGEFHEWDHPRWEDEQFGLLLNDSWSVRHTWKLLDIQALMDSPVKWTPEESKCNVAKNSKTCDSSRGRLHGYNLAEVYTPHSSTTVKPCLPCPPMLPPHVLVSSPLGPCWSRCGSCTPRRDVASSAAPSKASPWQRQLPNVLTTLRVLMVFPILVLFYSPRRHLPRSRHLWCAALFASASLTDFLDGYLARRWQVTSAFGKFLDPVADKLLACAVLVLLPTAVSSRSAPLLVVPAVLIILREILVSALREWTALAGFSAVSQVGFLGKLKTATILISLCGLLATCDAGLKSPFFKGALVLLYIGTFFAVLSGMDYFLKSLDAFRSK